ncbi:IS1249 family transposase [Neomicrococcus lactis]|uniref:IS1249 family transposase n=1 Tax=Neomicrococcus lactis TaxID=732241 RepID=UPI0023019861|nr:IS1249 family transposase [Neomicrococcus lactis]
MPATSHRPRCGVCDCVLVKNGKTSAGRTRWRCKSCGASQVRSRSDVTRKSELTQFLTWILGTQSQAAMAGSARGFRKRIQWCWRVEVPPPVPTGVVHHQLMLDGTYFNGWCVLIAYNGQHVVDWQWCDREKKIAWQVLLERIPAPAVAIIDGGTGLRAALKETWPESKIQRCYFHVFQNIRRELTFQTRIPAGKELAALTRVLMKVSTQDEAIAWLREYAAWEAKWDEFLKHRTKAKTGQERPSSVSRNSRWWYTHQRLRRARNVYRRLIQEHCLFTWLDTDLQPDTGEKIHRTTSPLEGGPNKAIKELLRLHRGLPEEHARTAVDWLLESLTEHPRQPWSLVKPEHLNPAQRTKNASMESDESQAPETYSNHFSWEDGNGIQTGWAGRNQP